MLGVIRLKAALAAWPPRSSNSFPPTPAILVAPANDNCASPHSPRPRRLFTCDMHLRWLSTQNRVPEIVQSSVDIRSQQEPLQQPASTCSSKQRSSRMMSSLARFTAFQSKIITTSNSDVVVRSSEPVFHFLRLPAELRETIYLFAVQSSLTPLDTAAIPGTPDRVHIPPVAQASKQLRGKFSKW